MKGNQTNTNNYSKEDTIDLVELIKKAWERRDFIIKLTLISFVIGCLVALTKPIIYESQTIFIPQTSENGKNEGYAQLASLAGININSESTLDKYISPLLYSKIIESDEFSLDLINEEIIYPNEEKIKIKDYLLLESNSFDIIGFVKKYTIGIFKKAEENKVISKELLNEYNFISNGDYSMIQQFKGKFSIEVNKKEGYINVTANDKDAFVSTQIVKLVTRSLQSKIISLRTNKIKEQLDYSREQYNQKQIEFEKLQNNLAEFKDSNKNISTAVFLAELEKLESEYRLQQNILISLASEYNNNKIKLNKDTPIFSVLDEVSVPNLRSKPNRKIIVLTYVFLGIIISIFYIFSKEYIEEIIQKLKEN